MQEQPASSSHDLFARLEEQGWGTGSGGGNVIGALQVLRALAAKPSHALRRWRAQDEVPLLVAVLRALAGPMSSSSWSWGGEAEEEAAVLVLELLWRWAASAASPLALDTAWAGARAGSEASCSCVALAAGSSPRRAMVVHATVRLWLFLAAHAPVANEGAVALQEAARLLTAPRSVEVLLAAGEEPWRHMLGALLFFDAPASPAFPIRYRAARLALETVARTPLLWAWDALAAVLTGAAAHGDYAGEWREAVVQAALDAMEGDAVCPWAGHAAGAVAAAALLAQSAAAAGNGGAPAGAGAGAAGATEEEDKRLWRAFPRLTQAMAPATVERRWTATPTEEDDWRTARVGLARALMLLGLSGFCTRSFRGAGEQGRDPATAAVAVASTAAAGPGSSSSSSSSSSHPSGGGGCWVPAQEWGTCLAAFLRLSLEEVVPSASTFVTQPQALRHQTLAQALCERGLGPASSQEWARALTHMLKAADAENQRAALVTLRTYSRSLAASASASASASAAGSGSGDAVQQRLQQQRQGAYGAALVLQTCLVLGDPSSAAVGSTEQAARVFEILEATSSLVPLGGAGAGAGAGGTGMEAGGASPAALEWALLRAAGNLQAVLEEDGEEGGLRNVRDWVMHELLRGKQQYGNPKAAQAANRRAFLVHLAFALCIETRRPAPHQYVADLSKFLLDRVQAPTMPLGLPLESWASGRTASTRGISPSSSSDSSSPTGGTSSKRSSSGVAVTAASAAVAAELRVQALVHKSLRKLLANPHLLAYRAGRKEHWDEARRRVAATYIGAALAGYPATTRFSDLAYSVGAALGAIPTAGDPGGQAVLLHCIGLLQNRALALITRPSPGDGDSSSSSSSGSSSSGGGGGGGGAQLQAPATVELVRLLFQTTIVCPPALLGAVLDSLKRDFFLGRALQDRPEARLWALRLLKEVVFGEVETMRQARLAKWYLGLLNDEGSLPANLMPQSRL